MKKQLQGNVLEIKVVVPIFDKLLIQMRKHF
ncbi:hypothetical protein AsAng_0016170 [Aureispira anguillae]|uniref:Uncharacterized protein n=1 Tax=Aureispira anguillae TaxID=2864201 RepID=A0A915YD51_9BACT|nr:hypothetical protein AsAng_0016170 [Aureispira anguillae]